MPESNEMREKIRAVLLLRIPELSDLLSPEVFERLVSFLDEASYGSAAEGYLSGLATQPIKPDKN